MFSGLKKHTLRDGAAIAWLGSLPEHWETARGKALFRREKREPLDGDGVVTCFRDGLVTLRSNRRLTGFTEAIQEHGYQRVLRGDLVIHAMDAFAGAVGVSDSDGKSSPVYAACTPRTTANPHYYAAAVREMARTSWIAALSRGVRERSTDFRFETFANQLLPVPPADEQAAIVKYLGHAHARIDRAIAAKRKLIALLEEQKQAIIHQAVTRGLDPSVPLKDSGIPWLGEIPAHWEVERAKYVLREVDERSTSGDEVQLSVSHLTGVSPRKSTVTMFRAESYVGHKICQPDDLVVNTMWAWMGALGAARDVGIVSPAYGVYRLRSQVKVRSEFLDLTLRTPRYISYFKSESTGIRSSRLRLYPNQVLSTPLLIPPLSEQASIVDHLDDRKKELDQVRVKAFAEIELLREFRTRLTSDVVTGQVDVREIASTLPELTDDVLASEDDEFGDVDELIESELEFAGADE